MTGTEVDIHCRTVHINQEATPNRIEIGRESNGMENRGLKGIVTDRLKGTTGTEVDIHCGTFHTTEKVLSKSNDCHGSQGDDERRYWAAHKATPHGRVEHMRFVASIDGLHPQDGTLIGGNKGMHKGRQPPIEYLWPIPLDATTNEVPVAPISTLIHLQCPVEECTWRRDVTHDVSDTKDNGESIATFAKDRGKRGKTGGIVKARSRSVFLRISFMPVRSLLP